MIKQSDTEGFWEEFEENQNVSPAGPQPATLENYTAPGADALLPTGVVFSSPWKNPADGMGAHARETLQAMALAGVPVRAESSGSGLTLDDSLPPHIEKLSYLQQVSMASTCVNIKHIVFNSYDYLKNQLMPCASRFEEVGESTVAKNTIIYTSWERSTVRKDLVALLNQARAVWVPCIDNAEAFESSGVKNVSVVPYSFDPGEYTTAFPRGKEDVPDGKRFYHIGKWEPRKNQHRIIGAFLMAYGPKDKASLMVKTSDFGSWANYPTPDESVEHWLDEPRVKEKGWTQEFVEQRIRIINKKIPFEDIQKLHTMNNIYISAAHAEAWDIPAFESRLHGNRLVYTGYGGPADYAGDEDVCIQENPGMVPVNPNYRWEKEAEWADVSIDSLIGALQRAEPPRARIFDHKLMHFSRANVGQKIREKLLGHYPILATVRGFG